MANIEQFKNVVPLWFRESSYGYRSHFTLGDRPVQSYEQHGFINPITGNLEVIEGAQILHAGLYAGYMAVLRGQDTSIDIELSGCVLLGHLLTGSSANVSSDEQLIIRTFFRNIDTSQVEQAFGRIVDEVEMFRVSLAALAIADQQGE